MAHKTIANILLEPGPRPFRDNAAQEVIMPVPKAATPPSSQTTPPIIDLDQTIVAGLEIKEMPDVDALEAEENAGPGGSDHEPPTPPARPEPTADNLEGKKPPADAPPEKPPQDFRFKTHEEAEAGYKNMRAHITRIEQDNAALKKAEVDRVKAEQDAAARVAMEEAFDKHNAEQHTTALKKIEALDPDVEDHAAQVATIMAERDAAVRKFVYEPSAPTPATLPATPPPPPPDDLTTDQFDEIQQHVDQQVTAAGLMPDDMVFSHFANRAPEVDTAGNRLTLDQQILWSLGQTRGHMVKELLAAEAVPGKESLSSDDPVLQHFLTHTPSVTEGGEAIPMANQVADAIQKTNEHKAALRSKILAETSAPLRRGSPTATPRPTAPAAGITLDSALTSAAERRRL